MTELIPLVCISMYLQHTYFTTKTGRGGNVGPRCPTGFCIVTSYAFKKKLFTMRILKKIHMNVILFRFPVPTSNHEE